MLILCGGVLYCNSVWCVHMMSVFVCEMCAMVGVVGVCVVFRWLCVSK